MPTTGWLGSDRIGLDRPQQKTSQPSESEPLSELAEVCGSLNETANFNLNTIVIANANVCLPANLATC